MKILLIAATLLASFAVSAQTPELQNLSKSQVEDVANEFAMNFSHTVVAAPETKGVWGVEVGVVAGQTDSPELKKVVSQAGEDGSDFEKIYHAGVVARAHFPYELFLEASLLPEREISDVEVSARSLGVGWNFGSFFQLPLDVAIGASMSRSEIGFKQQTTQGGVPVETNISVDSDTSTYWVGVSKTFLFFTPYAKIGKANSESEVKTSVAGNVFGQDLSGQDKVDVKSDGNYWAVGANLEFAFFKIGVETSRQADVSRTSAKLALDF